MPWRLASRNTTARGGHPLRRQPRTSTDPAPLCLIGSSMVSCPQRPGPLFGHWATTGGVFGLLAKRS
eukprot:1469515-Pyramimonas_sp.AAC.1